MRLAIPLSFSAALVISGIMTAAPASTTIRPRTPVLLELFTSEGCSSCPPADRLLESLDKDQPVSDADLIVLSEHVDYWNHDGWSDPYSAPLFSQRQLEYARQLRLEEVYTPQLVVDGASELVGSNEQAARSAIARATAHGKLLAIELSDAARSDDHVSFHLSIPKVKDANETSAAVFVAVADERDRSQVSRGENAGKALQHVAVVRALKQIGTVGETSSSKEISVAFPSRQAGHIRIVVFAQDMKSHRVIGVSQAKL